MGALGNRTGRKKKNKRKKIQKNLTNTNKIKISHKSYIVGTCFLLVPTWLTIVTFRIAEFSLLFTKASISVASLLADATCKPLAFS